MEIQVINGSTITLKGKGGKVAINFTGSNSTLKKLNLDFLIGGKPIDGTYQILTPGEYEKNDVLVTAYQSPSSKENDADIYEADMDRVNSCYLGEEVTELSESILDQLGIVNVLFLHVSKTEASKKLVNLIDPNIIIPIGLDKDGMKKFMTSLGMASIEEDTKLKVESRDFMDEEIPTRLVHLTK